MAVQSRRILIIDDSPTIHGDFRKILGAAVPAPADDLLDLFAGDEFKGSGNGFEVDAALQGRDGLARLQEALLSHRPYAVAFVDGRMPPGWDGVETIKHLWALDPRLEVVFCSAYTDYTWEQMNAALVTSDNLVILKKPFDVMEVRQLAKSLVMKWNLAREAELRLGEMERVVAARTEELRRAHEEVEIMHRVAREQLEKELQIAIHIQTAVLPRECRLAGLEIATRMIPAHNAGGDYFDVISGTGGSCAGGWIGIGDVAGHGVAAGMVMLMVQSGIGTLVRRTSNDGPAQMLTALNALLYDNIRQRMGQDEHVTLTLLRYTPDGRITFAGAHEEILIYRPGTSRCQRIDTPGPWFAAIKDVSPLLVENHFQLHDGDLLVLYSDGVTEARNAHHQQFGIDRLCAEIEARGTRPVGEIVTAIVEGVLAWDPAVQDDISLIVARYSAPTFRNVTSHP